MARPRVFISSTYYDLKHLRSTLENFIESLGFDAILSEKGDIAYTPDLPLDESCYREVENSEIFVLIIGGRYGSEISSTKTAIPKSFYERYNSITREEYQSATRRDISIYILIERSVYSEYETYLKNKNNSNISYAHVDSVNIFELIESILNQPRNNPVLQFDKYNDIERWLREQWAGLFRELLHRMQGQKQIITLQSQVGQLAESNTTLKRYLEQIVSKIAPKESEKLIKSETKRLRNALSVQDLKTNPLVDYLNGRYRIPVSKIIAATRKSTSLSDFIKLVSGDDDRLYRSLRSLELSHSRMEVLRDLNKLRRTLKTAELSDEYENTESRFDDRSPDNEKIRNDSKRKTQKGSDSRKIKLPIKEISED